MRVARAGERANGRDSGYNASVHKWDTLVHGRVRRHTRYRAAGVCAATFRLARIARAWSSSGKSGISVVRARPGTWPIGSGGFEPILVAIFVRAGYACSFATCIDTFPTPLSQRACCLANGYATRERFTTLRKARQEANAPRLTLGFCRIVNFQVSIGCSNLRI